MLKRTESVQCLLFETCKVFDYQYRHFCVTMMFLKSGTRMIYTVVHKNLAVTLACLNHVSF